jgi:hypothetical protein
MLAMLLFIRDKLVEGDSNECLGLLMKYPRVSDVTPIMDLADMLRRGVLSSNAHLGADAAAASSPTNHTASKPNQPPSWLLTNPILPVINQSTINDMSKR